MHLSPLSFKEKEGSLEQYTTHVMKAQALPDGHNLVHQVLDVNNERTFTLYARESDYPSERVLKLLVLDWKSNEDIIINTGLIRVSSRILQSRQCVWTNTYFKEDKIVAARVSLNQDSSEVTVYRYDYRSWAHASFDVSRLYKAKNSDSPAGGLASNIEHNIPEAPVFRAPLETYFEHETPILEPILYRYWSLPFPQQLSSSSPAPQIHSHIQLSVSLDCLRSRYWCIRQFYSDDHGPGMRSSLVLRNLYVKKSGMALLSVSFSHIAWVESGTTEFPSDPQGSTPAKPTVGKTIYRRLRLATFLPPGSIDTKFEPMTLEIPNSCLASVRSIYIEPALASVFVLCKGNRLHKYSFA